MFRHAVFVHCNPARIKPAPRPCALFPVRDTSRPCYFQNAENTGCSLSDSRLVFFLSFQIVSRRDSHFAHLTCRLFLKRNKISSQNECLLFSVRSWMIEFIRMLNDAAFIRTVREIFLRWEMWNNQCILNCINCIWRRYLR